MRACASQRGVCIVFLGSQHPLPPPVHCFCHSLCVCVSSCCCWRCVVPSGVFVRPKPYRAVLMDQDVAHRLSTPSAVANRPRYSLVWKLVMTPRPTPAQQQQEGRAPRLPGAAACIARKEWGQPTYFGSAAHVLKMAKSAAAAAAATVEAAAPGTQAAASPSASSSPERAAKRQHV